MNLTRTAIAVAIGCTALNCAYAEPAATVLFTQPGSSIVDAAGVSRPAKRGDVVQAGERLLTAPNGISQVAMADGSLIGMRPGTELRFDAPVAGASAARQTVSLVQGAVRVIGAELMDANKLSAVTFKSGDAILQMRGADLETARVVGGPAATASEGSYSRLLVGTASIGTGQTVTALAPRQVSFVAPTSITPITVSPPMTLFTGDLLGGSALRTITPTTAPAPTTKTALVGTLVAPTTLTSTLIAPPPPSPTGSSTLVSSLNTNVIVKPLAVPVTPIVAAPVINTPVIAAPVINTPIIAAPIVVTPVFVPPPVVVAYVPPPVYVPPPILVVKTCSVILTRTVCK